MARRNDHFLLDLAHAPWPVGVVAGIFVLLFGKVVVPGVLAASDNQFLKPLGAAVSGGALDALLWVVAGACWVAALVSLLSRGRRRRLLDTQTGLSSLRALSWRDFERLVAEAFHRRGYAVAETGLGGADGGIDLLLQRDGRRTLVQCKQWKTQRVGVVTVREQFGLLTHHGADEAILVTTGDYTAEAKAFARGKPIRLIAGEELFDMVRGVQQAERTPAVVASPSLGDRPSTDPPTCPRCGSGMVKRAVRATGAPFLGCSQFPRCRGIRNLLECAHAGESP
jgi:restriction system protein